jgi:DHA2 family multidrug resistance protein-like MFS transporter
MIAHNNKKRTENVVATPPRASRREWIGLAVLALPALLISMDLSVLYLAVPRLSAALRPSGAQLLWITDIYGFLLAGFLITMGTLGDRIGHRRLLMLGAAAFGLASTLAAFSTSAATLIAARALLGVAAATLSPSALALISHMFKDPQQRTLAISVWVTSLSAGGAVGPLLGGALLDIFWWGSVFLVGVPVMVLLLVTAPLLLPKYRNTKAARLDLTSVALSLATILLTIYGLKQIAQDGPGWLPALAIVAGLAVGVMFVRRQYALAEPLINLRLFRVPAFSASLAINTLGFFVVLGVFFFTAQYLQLVLGLSPLQAGLWTVPSFGGFILGSLLTPLLVRSTRPAYVMAAGLVLSAVGFGVLTQIDSVSGLTVLVTGSVVLSLGTAPVFTLVTNMVLGSVPPERAGAASGMSETSTEFGGALGIAILGSVGTAVYRSQVARTIPVGISTEAARNTLGGAVAAAGQLPTHLGTALLVPAREAFINGLHTVSGLSAATVAVLAVFALILLRHVQLSSETSPTNHTANQADANPSNP